MLITVLIVIFALIALYLGWYLLAHRNRSFLVFKPQNTPSLSHVLIFFGALS